MILGRKDSKTPRGPAMHTACCPATCHVPRPERRRSRGRQLPGPAPPTIYEGADTRVGTISRIRTPNPNYPNLIPNYPNPNYPITISSRKLRNPNLIRVIWVLTPGTRITRTLLKPNRLWLNPLTWPQQPNKKFISLICWLLVCLICTIIVILLCWSYFYISFPFLLVA